MRPLEGMSSDLQKIWRIYTEGSNKKVHGERRARAAGNYQIRPTSNHVTVKKGNQVLRVVRKEECERAPGRRIDVKDGRTFVCRIERPYSDEEILRSLDEKTIWAV